jgi:hypothetical protein
VNLIKLILLVAVVGAGIHFWKKHDAQADAVASAAASENGFVAIPLPDGMPNRGVVIFAPANCPSDAAKRADALASHLSARGIPHSRSQSADFNNLSDAAAANRVMAVMNGDVPIVFVNGKARANPSPEQVVSEYRGSAG